MRALFVNFCAPLIDAPPRDSANRLSFQRVKSLNYLTFSSPRVSVVCVNHARVDDANRNSGWRRVLERGGAERSKDARRAGSDGIEGRARGEERG